MNGDSQMIVYRCLCGQEFLKKKLAVAHLVSGTRYHLPFTYAGAVAQLKGMEREVNVEVLGDRS